MAIYELSKEIIFPNPELAEDDGLLAIGGDLSLERLILAYTNGIFPWYSGEEPILWWCPKERFILKPKEIRVSKSMKKIIKRNDFKITFNKDFEGVIRNCRIIRENQGTWINDDMEKAYTNLFYKGFASSVEVYKDDALVGGLYGVNIGKCFFGESMFSKENNSSKLALISLANKLEKEEYLFIDCQMHTKHLESMGGKFIDYSNFKNMITLGIKM